MSEKKRIAIFIIILFLAVAGCICFVFAGKQKSDARNMEYAKDDIVSAVNQKAATLSAILESRIEALETLYSSSAENDVLDRGAFKDKLAEIVDVSVLRLYDIALIDKSGADLITGGQAAIPIGNIGSALLEHVNSQSGATPPYFRLTIPIEGKSGSSIYLTGCFDEGALNNLLPEREYKSDAGQYYLISGNLKAPISLISKEEMYGNDELILSMLSLMNENTLYAPSDAQPLLLARAQISSGRLVKDQWYIVLVQPYHQQFHGVLLSGLDILEVALIFAAFVAVIAWLLYLLEKDHRKKKEMEEQALIRREKEYQLIAEDSGYRTFRYVIALDKAYYCENSFDSEEDFKPCLHPAEHFLALGKVDATSADEFRQMFKRIAAGESNFNVDIRLVRPNCHICWFRFHIHTLFSNDRPETAIISYHDCTQEREREAAFAKWQQELDSLSLEHAAIIEWNLTKDFCINIRGNMVFLPPEFSTANIDVQTKMIAESFVFSDDIPAFIKLVNRDNLIDLFSNGVTSKTMELRIGPSPSDMRYYRLSVQLIPYPESGQIKACFVFEDVDSQKRASLALIARSQNDTLTEVLNRKTLIERAGSLFLETPQSQHALLMIDVDGFKTINDTMGHAFGDKVLTRLVKDLLTVLRKTDLIGRVGGDEFVIILNGIADKKAIADKAAHLAQIVRRQLSGTLYITVSTGIALYPNDAVTFEALYACADEAMYYAKQHHKGGCCFYRKPMITEDDMIHPIEAAASATEYDSLTGLYTRDYFIRLAEDMIKAHEAGFYVMSCFDINGFKVINDQYGSDKGDDVLISIARSFNGFFKSRGGICARVTADVFALLYPVEYMESESIRKLREESVAVEGLKQALDFSIGRYIINDLSLSVSAMYDRASIAKDSIKGRYDLHIAYFNDSMREKILTEQAIINDSENSLRQGEFEVWFQPQYNHSTRALIGAEVLVRWRHPIQGIIPPSTFIPIFERNGFIFELDQFVWRQSAMLLRKWLDTNRSPLPISINVSRQDIFHNDFYRIITSLVHEYELPVSLLRLEITESAFVEAPEQIIDMVDRLRGFGFMVEIDDFGSGYSSLNTLKNVHADILKLDMRFLDRGRDSERGGTILESIIRMAKWLRMPVIAEGVETLEQADFLKSIGCSYIQGYLYAKPMPCEEYEALTASGSKEHEIISMHTIDKLNSNAFWSPSSMDTLIFNSFVGGALVLEFHHSTYEILRANQKIAEMLGGKNFAVSSLLSLDLREYMDMDGRNRFRRMIMTAIKTMDDVSGEVHFGGLPGEFKNVYIHCTLRIIGNMEDRWLFYCACENVTEKYEAELLNAETSEQLTFLNHIAHVLVAENDPDRALREMLSKMISHFGAKRAYIFQKNDDNSGSFRNSYEICAKGVSPQIDNLQNISHHAMLRWLKYFEQRKLVVIEDVDQLSEDRSEEKRILSDQGIHSLIAVSLRQGRHIVGMLGIDDPKRTGKYISSLDTLAYYVTSMLSRKAYRNNLQNENKSMRVLLNETPGGFSRIEIDSKENIRSMIVNDEMTRLLKLTKQEIIAAYQKDCYHFIHPDDLARVKKAFAKDYQENEMLHLKLRVICGDGSVLPVYAHYRLTTDDQGTHYINAFYMSANEC